MCPMPRSNVPRVVLIATALLCIAIAFFSLAMAIDYLRTLIMLEWTGLLAALLVVLILLISVSTLVAVFGLYYWLAATISPLHMADRASVAKMLRYLGLQGLTFWEIPQVIGPYSHSTHPSHGS